MTAALSFLILARRSEISELEQLALTGRLVGVMCQLIHALQRERGLASLHLAAGSGPGAEGHGRVSSADRSAKGDCNGGGRHDHDAGGAGGAGGEGGAGGAGGAGGDRGDRGDRGDGGGEGASRPAYATQIRATDQAGVALQRWFDDLDADPGLLGGRARLFNLIAFALQGLQELSTVRARVGQHRWGALEAAEAYTRLIAALLAVVFEAADTAPDPEVSRLLVAVFNLIQAKEYAGQERAIGAALFTGGHAGSAHRQTFNRLIEAQERCVAAFETFAPESLAQRARAAHSPEAAAGHERMRRILLSAGPETAPDRELGLAWFDACSRRLDAMRSTEDALQGALGELCQRRIAAARQDLATFQSLADQGRPTGSPGAVEAPFYDDRPPVLGQVEIDAWAGRSATEPLGPRLGRSVLELVQDQSQRLHTMRAELDDIRATLDERKVIERAKGLLMALRRLNEDQAHRTLRQMAMNHNRRLVDIAQAVLTLSDMLGDPPAGP